MWVFCLPDTSLVRILSNPFSEWRKAVRSDRANPSAPFVLYVHLGTNSVILGALLSNQPCYLFPVGSPVTNVVFLLLYPVLEGVAALSCCPSALQSRGFQGWRGTQTGMFRGITVWSELIFGGGSIICRKAPPSCTY